MDLFSSLIEEITFLIVALIGFLLYLKTQKILRQKSANIEKLDMELSDMLKNIRYND